MERSKRLLWQLVCLLLLSVLLDFRVLAVCNQASGGGGWINNSFANQTGTFTAEFDATPSMLPSNMHVGLSNGAKSAYTGFAIIIRFNTSGNIDARNGGAYAAVSAIPYAANISYHFRVVVNVSAHTYSVYVTPADSTEKVVASNYAFRTEQSTVSQLNNWGAFVEGSSGSLQVCNFQVGSSISKLINETFDTSASNFTTSGGTWNVSGGRYILSSPNDASAGNGNLAIHNTNVSGDYTFTVDATATSSSSTWDDFSVIFGYQDAQNYYFASFNESNDANTNGIFRVQSGTATQITDFSATTTAGSSLHAIKIEVSGNSVKVSRGSTLLGTASISGSMNGRVGVGTRNNAAIFDNLIVSVGGTGGVTPTPTPANPTPTISPTATPTPSPTPSGKQVGQWDRFEASVTNSKTYSDPYNGVTLNVTYTKPDGSKVNFWGFYDGGNTWRIRFMPDKLGVWQYEARFSDGTQGISGNFTCVPSSIPGMIHKDETNPRWFGFKGGKHILLRSLHMGPIFETTFSDSKRKALFDWAQQQGYNMFSSSSFFSVKERESRGPKLWPLNAEQYRHVERILDDLSDRRFIVWGFAGWFGDGRPYPKTVEGEKQYIKYGLARFGPYWNMLWNVGGPEPNLNNYLTSEDVNRIGREIRSQDVFDHLRSVHNRHGNYPYKNADWSSYATLQGSDSENKDLNVQSAYLLRQHTGDKPVYGQEDLWVGNTKQPACCFDATTVRRWVWMHMVSAVTLNYGDNNGSGGTGFSGSGDLADKKQERHDWIKPVWDYFGSIPFYRMSPNQSLVNNGFCLAEEGAQYMVYLPFGGSVSVKVIGGPYNVTWINAQNPNEKRNGGTTSNGQNLNPPGSDWVLYLTK
jgi:hypothetical protein